MLLFQKYIFSWRRKNTAKFWIKKISSPTSKTEISLIRLQSASLVAHRTNFMIKNKIVWKKRPQQLTRRAVCWRGRAGPTRSARTCRRPRTCCSPGRRPGHPGPSRCARAAGPCGSPTARPASSSTCRRYRPPRCAVRTAVSGASSCSLLASTGPASGFLSFLLTGEPAGIPEGFLSVRTVQIRRILGNTGTLGYRYTDSRSKLAWVESDRTLMCLLIRWNLSFNAWNAASFVGFLW